MQNKMLRPALLGLWLASVATAGDLSVKDYGARPEDLAVRAELSARLDQIAADPKAYEDAIYFGEMRATLCKVCHGADGNSVREGTPNLAGQDPVYIVDQFNRYADGRRKDYWMGSLAGSFSTDDKIKLAVFYSEQETRPARGGKDHLVGRGRELYATFCKECHGADGRAEQGYARLAGQRPEYVVKMLQEFRTPSGKRFNPLMYARSYMLDSVEEMEAVAAYLAQLD